MISEIKHPMKDNVTIIITIYVLLLLIISFVLTHLTGYMVSYCLIRKPLIMALISCIAERVILTNEAAKCRSSVGNTANQTSGGEQSSHEEIIRKQKDTDWY